MFGLAVLFGFAVYCLITLVLMWAAARIARKRGIKGWKWSLPVLVVMYLILFQDHIPSLILHDYYCNSSRAGFWVYKTLDEWKKENPSEWETLAPDALPEKYLTKVMKRGSNRSVRYYQLPDGSVLKAHFKGSKISTTDLQLSDGAKGYWLNQRFSWAISNYHTWFHVYMLDWKIIDNNNNEVVARRVDYSSKILPFGITGLPIEIKSCEPERNQISRKRFYQFKRIVGKQKE